MALREKHGQEIDTILSRYAQPRSAVIPLLYVAQDEYGHLTDAAIREVADILGLPATDVFEVVGFYTLFYKEPVGKWMLQVCDDVPCCFLGAEELVGQLEQKLGIRVDQTTPDGMFTLQRVKCLADCDRAPMLQANLEFYRNVDTAEKVDAMLNELRQRAGSGEVLSVSGRFAER
jgi:NADH-quinone oxidoreductase subunit E